MSDLTAFRRRLDDYLRAEGLKHTRQRQVILEAFVEAGGHISLDDLLTRVQAVMPGVGYATVYRSMKLFSEAGLAQEQKFGDGQARYEPAKLGDSHHDHIVCVRCGRILEFEDDIIEARQEDIAARHGMRMVSHRLDIWAECVDPDGCSHDSCGEE